MGRLIALALCLAVALGLAWRTEQTPSPAPADAPATEFSASRALPDVAAIAATPHPIGTPQNTKVRDHLLQRLNALGLETQVQVAQSAVSNLYDGETYVVGGRVENLIAVLPGRDRTAPALAIMAHYDSVPGSPGAADDAAGVSSALEVARALKAKGLPARDVILILTDGEEAGLLGARAFFRDHPLAKRVGFLINMEARGGGGRVQMFQTGPLNGGVVELFRRTAASPLSSSLTVFIYEQMPNDTDFTVSKDAGVPGLNFAFIGKQFDYHSPTSTPENLDKGSLQHMGDLALAAAREVAFSDSLPAKAPDLVYANTFGSHILAYPPQAGWLFLIAAAALIAGGAWQARRENGLRWLDIGKGLGAALYLVAVSAALLRIARQATGADFGFIEQRFLLAQADRWEIALLIVGLGALVLTAAAAGRGRMRLAGAALALAAGLGCSAFGDLDPIGAGMGALGAILALLSFGRPTSVAGGWTGLLLSALIVAIGLQIAAAPAAFLVAWPLTIGAVGGAISAMGVRRSAPMQLLLAAIAAVTAAWLLAMGHFIFLGLDIPDLLALVVWLIALVVWPLVQPLETEKNARTLGLAVLLLGFVTVAVVRYDPPWTARHPQTSPVLYYLDMDARRALRVSNTTDLTDWARQVLRADGGTISMERLPFAGRKELPMAPARMVAASPAAMGLTLNADGTRTLRLTPPPEALSLGLDLKATVPLRNVSVNGLPLAILDKPGQRTRMRFANAPGGVVITFRTAGPGQIDASFATTTPGWPAEAKPLPPRPVNEMAFDRSDSTVVASSARFTW